MESNEKHLLELLKVLNEEGTLNDFIVIGSWCLLFYKYVFENFEPTIRTTDIDFFIPNPKSIKEKNGLIKALKEINYDLVRDSLTNKSIFISPDGFEIEFLTKLNRNNISCIRLGSTGIYAESLSYTDIFIGNCLDISFYGISAKVASPASYVLQKLLINEKRGEKQEKDIESIKHVLFYIGASEKYKKELINLFESLPKSWKKKINRTLSIYNFTLF